MVPRIALFKNKNSRPSAFRKASKTTGTLNRLFRRKNTKASNHQSLPSLAQHHSQTLTWTLSDGSDSSRDDIVCSDLNHGLTSKVFGFGHHNNQEQDWLEAQRQKHVREIETMQRQMSSLQQTLIELSSNEEEYQNLCDEYETLSREQELEITRKECKILYLKRLMEALESRIANETSRRKDLETTLTSVDLLREEQERESRNQQLEIFKRDLEIKFQKGIYKSLAVRSQADQERLRGRASEQEKVILDLKENLSNASRQNLEQAKQIDGLKRKLRDVTKKQQYADAAKAEAKKAKKNSRDQWSIWSELILD